MTLKTALILTQLVGYLSSKFIGIKVTSESKGKQDYILVVLCLFSEASLVLFGILGTYATDWCFIAMFLNGLPLGMVWGLVVSYFEGRAGADFMMVALCISFIVGSGVVKDIALALLDAGYSQFWVPAIEGGMFAVLWLICIVGLNQLPPPSEVDKKDRGERISMDHQMRLEYYLAFWPGLLALWLGAVCLTAYRDYRDSFAVEIIEDMGVDVVPGTLSKTESIIAGCLMIPIASLVFIKDNVKSFGISLFFLVAGAIILLVATTAYIASPYDGINYYMVTGLGSYLGYVPYNSVLYERLIGSLRKPCTVSYLVSHHIILYFFSQQTCSSFDVLFSISMHFKDVSHGRTRLSRSIRHLPRGGVRALLQRLFGCLQHARSSVRMAHARPVRVLGVLLLRQAPKRAFRLGGKFG